MAHRTRSPFYNSTSFRPGPDPRRHRFTREECSRGGRTTWRRIMTELRLAMNLPLPSKGLRAEALRILERRQNKNRNVNN